MGGGRGVHWFGQYLSIQIILQKMIIVSPQAAIHNLQLKLPGHKSLTNAFYSAEYFLGGSFIVTRAPLVRSKYQLTRHWSQLRESSPQFRHAPPPYKIPRQNWKILQKASVSVFVLISIELDKYWDGSGDPQGVDAKYATLMEPLLCENSGHGANIVPVQEKYWHIWLE